LKKKIKSDKLKKRRVGERGLLKQGSVARRGEARKGVRG
jgi:hypothetical protein